jgi:uncharacterized protein YndB with AHSA1/START domain
VNLVSARIEVAAPAAEVWDLVADFRHWPEWGTSIRAVDSAAQSVTPGVGGRVRTVVGLWLPFTITEVEPGRSWHWKVAGLTATGHRVIEVDSGHSIVEFTAPRLLAPYVIVLRAALRRLKTLAEQPR